ARPGRGGLLRRRPGALAGRAGGAARQPGGTGPRARRPVRDPVHQRPAPPARSPGGGRVMRRCLLLLVCAVAGCTGPAGPVVTVGSKAFPESLVLGEMAA